jgi:hypothetical protein
MSFSVFSVFMTASLPAAQSSSHPAYSIPQPIKTIFTAEFKAGKIATRPASLVSPQRATGRNKMAMMILFRKIARCGMIGRRNR